MIGDRLTLTLFLLPFFVISILILVDVLNDLSYRGITCRSSFLGTWIFAYSVPTLVYLLSPNSVKVFPAVSWMTDLDWALSAWSAIFGAILFMIGYRFRRHTSSPKILLTEKLQFDPGIAFVSLICISIIFQILPIYIVWSNNISIHFGSRIVQWSQLGLTGYLLYFCLPAVVLSAVYWLNQPSIFRISILLISLMVGTVSATVAGQRMFLVLIPFFLFLLFMRKHGNYLRYVSISLVVVFFVAVGFVYFLRGGNEDGIMGSVFSVLFQDLSRSQTLGYTIHHANMFGSEIINTPIVSSYFYWLILPIPRSVWTAKPFATVLQYNYSFGYSLGVDYLIKPLWELYGGFAIGFIEEALMNLGFLGYGIVFLWGWIAASMDYAVRYPLITKVVLPVFFILTVLYPFNSMLMLFMPLLVMSFGLEIMIFLLPQRNPLVHVEPKSSATLSG